MKFSEQWLRTWVNPKVNSSQLADQLTMAGLEVDTVEPVASEFSNIVIGEVMACEKHPDATRLNVCEVNVGEEKPLSIVCGGVNVRAGIKVPVALVGATISHDIKIKKTKLRGVLSEGMICSAKELGIDDPEAIEGGIMVLSQSAPVGQDFRKYFELDDHLIDIELTPNRGDCLSILGIAREVALINHLPFHPMEIKTNAEKIRDTFSVNVSAKDACPRYVGRIIKNMGTGKNIPQEMQIRLHRSGIRLIHPIVDICNYVMIELGQPMHAFDLDKLSGEIHVRRAELDEKMTLIDGEEIQLRKDTLVIADNNKPQAIAGIMGGKDSMVQATTKNIFLESAYFNPIDIRIACQQHGLQTDSSYRFERGVDFNLQRKAIERATDLMIEILGGEVAPIIEAASTKDLPKEATILLRKAQIKRMLGIDLEISDIERILQALGMRCKKNEAGWEVIPPSYRFDIALEIDLIEELARVYGYGKIPAKPMQINLTMPTSSESVLPLSKITHLLTHRGYHETITYSFVDKALFSMIDPTHSPIALSNPIASDMSVMRSSLWPGLIKAMMFNLNRQAEHIRFFEIGQCFVDNGREWLQFSKLALIAAGSAYPEQWGLSKCPVDFYDIKGEIEAILLLTGDIEQFTWREGTHPALHPGQSADLYQKDRIVGHLGAIHPKIAQHLDLNQVSYLFEIELDAIKERKIPEYRPISKFPIMRRDIAIVVDKSVSVEAILKNIREEAGNLLNKVKIFDIYQGEGVEESKKSVALGLIFQDPRRTLIDDEINAIIQDVVAGLNREFNAKLRT